MKQQYKRKIIIQWYLYELRLYFTCYYKSSSSFFLLKKIVLDEPIYNLKFKKRKDIEEQLEKRTH